ncbi:MAG: BamA/TamA family outer membrane protein, partial [Pseudomonadota bacterium]|nr:BamA/TamA family outer membrane protein [Pseudomonadota bacterium]
WADNTLYTRHGGRLSLSLSGASEALLSDVTFGQVVLRGKYIRSIGENSRIITRAAVGATEVNDFEQLPSSLRFFAGGDNSIRGFDYQSLGPEGDDGEVEGGRYLAVGSLEYENMFLGDWGGAVFTDFGNAYNSFSDPIEYSVGVGVRWRSPVGLIRVDLAKALSDTDESIALHIVIGPDL